MAMDLSGEHRIPAPPATVWRALNDVGVLRDCIPGCEDVAATEPNHFRARVTARIGAIRATFNGRVSLSDLDPPNGYTISGQGEGGAAGFVRGSARVTLAAVDDDTTILGYVAKADVGGKLAAVGSRLVQGVAASTAAQFFDRFAAAAAAYGDAMALPQPKRDDHDQPRPASSPEHRGPAVATTPIIDPVPPEPTVPYTLGQTPRTQNAIIATGIILWLCVVAIMLLPA